MNKSPASMPRSEDSGRIGEVSGPAVPLKPRRGLLKVLSVVYALWLVALLAMYFTTVYPRTHPATTRSAIGAP